MITIKVGDNVQIIKLSTRLHKIGKVVKIVNTIKEKLYIVQFENGDYEYYKENDIAYRG